MSAIPTNVVPMSNTTSIIGARKVDTTRGTSSGALSSQWFSRPDDQRFLTLDDLYASVRARGDRSTHEIIDTKMIRVNASRDDGHLLELILPTKTGQVITKPTHWSFAQLCGHIGAPAGYLRQLPGSIAAINAQYGLASYRNEDLKPFWSVNEDGQSAELRAVTSPTYGRIMDSEVVDAVMKIAPDGSGWKVPGMMDWLTSTYDPDIGVTKQGTTLYASDRDVFIFLCRDKNPIEVGKLANGDPDYLFPGFIVSNSEVGAGALRIETFYLRGVCANRCIWGQEGYNSTVIRHSSGAPDRFLREAEPALLQFSQDSSLPVRNRVIDAKARIVADDADERLAFLRKQDFSKKAAEKVLDQFLAFEGRPAESVWDFVNAVTLSARDIQHQDDRISMERAAGKMMSLA